MSEDGDSVKLTEEQLKIGMKQTIINASDRELGQLAGKGSEEVASVIDLAKEAARENPELFYAGVNDTHWSNPDGPTGGMPPEAVEVKKPTTE